MSRDITDPNVKKLAKKLLDDFNVVLEDYSFKLNQDPIIILLFPKEATAHLNMLLSRPPINSLTFFIKKATLFAKSNSVVFPFVAEPTAVIVNTNPYKIKIQGLLPLIYFFVNCILTEK